jgi:putative oxidoreductase
METESDQLTSVGLLVVRVGAGAMMLFGHGIDKLLTFGHKASYFPDPFGIGSAPSLALATFAEFVCSILLILGLLTRLAALPLLVTMVVAALVIHADDPWSKKELALLYAVPFLSLLFTGPGNFSLDDVIGRKRRWLVG